MCVSAILSEGIQRRGLGKGNAADWEFFMPGVSSGLHVLFSELTPSGVTKFVVIYFAQRKGTSMPGQAKDVLGDHR